MATQLASGVAATATSSEADRSPATEFADPGWSASDTWTSSGRVPPSAVEVNAAVAILATPADFDDFDTHIARRIISEHRAAEAAGRTVVVVDVPEELGTTESSR